MTEEIITFDIGQTVFEEKGQQKTINARQLHEQLKVGRDFSNWIKDRIKKYNFVEGKHYVIVKPPRTPNQKGGNRRSVEYFITIDMAKEIAMVEHTEVGERVRQYFIDCEKIAQRSIVEQEFIVSHASKKKSELLIMAAEYQRQIEIAEEKALLLENKVAETQTQLTETQTKLEEAKPKVAFVDELIANGQDLSMTDVAKCFGITPKTFQTWLRDNGFLYRHKQQATRKALDLGVMIVKYYTPMFGPSIPYPHITGKGVYYFYERLLEDGVIESNPQFQQETFALVS